MKKKIKKAKKVSKAPTKRRPRVNKTVRTIAAITGEETAQIMLPIIGDEQNGKATHNAVCEFCGVNPPAGQYLWLVKKNDVWRESRHIIAPDSKTAIEFLGWDPKRILFAMIAKMPLSRQMPEEKEQRAKACADKTRKKRLSTIDKITGITPALTDPGTRIEKEISMKAQKKSKANEKSTAKKNTEARKVETKASNGTEKVTIKSLVISLFKKGVAGVALVKAVKKQFPKSKFNDYHAKWYGQRFRREGLIK